MADVLDDQVSSDRAQLSPDERAELHRVETREWLESLDYVLASGGAERATELLDLLEQHAHRLGVQTPFSSVTPYLNTIPVDEQPEYPGDLALEKRARALMRWNAMAMVVRANKESDGIGGHISTYASAATLYEVGFNHFFHGPDAGADADQVYFQGHASPGIYARAYLERRFDVERLRNFRRELSPTGPGLSSYPHPWLMPDFWQFPTVSMGLSPILSIYQARFNRYLEARGLKPKGEGKVWAYLGDGETDEPETLGAIKFAARERLDNLIWVINANLQRLDGPVFGNGSIIQELEGIFRGAGWNVIKVAWGSKWDELLAKDDDGVLARRFNQLIDGESQRYAAFGGSELRATFFDTPELAKLIEGWSDEELDQLNRGGHDPVKVYAAYHRAVRHEGSPTVILARTVKGYALGEKAEGKNPTHQQKKMDDAEMRKYRDRLNIPISDDEIGKFPFFRPDTDAPEIAYLLERREALGGLMPRRVVKAEPMAAPGPELVDEFLAGSDREVSTTMVFVSVLRKLLRDEAWGKLIVPIIPDEARTFGMEALFRQIGIYSSVGQLYEPVDKENLMYYRETKDGQILEEGITEAGAMSSFVAAGTAYATHGVNAVPFYIYYSMFGFQRIGDLAWLAGDMRTKGFMLGATAGRTTLAGEGLQHQDGQSHLLAYPIPNLEAYDPTFAYELAIVIREGMRRMYEEQESVFYYLTVGNENKVQPAAPEHLTREELEDGVLEGLYLFRPSPKKRSRKHVQLIAAGAMMHEALAAAEKLEADYGVAAHVWSVTSLKALHRDALDVERWNRLHPTEEPRVPYVRRVLEGAKGPLVAATDYVKILVDALGRHAPRPIVALGTDGFGRSEARAELRDFFEVDAKHIVFAALTALADDGAIERKDLAKAIDELGIDPEKPNPAAV
ncbi:MAG: pyruvate dehydrogenase (acetyl-transferring), homodimeric type [Trueperaceae bacterium]